MPVHLVSGHRGNSLIGPRLASKIHPESLSLAPIVSPNRIAAKVSLECVNTHDSQMSEGCSRFRV
jgi:hypothetical protein